MRMILFTAFYLMLTSCFAQNSTPKYELGLSFYGNEILIGHGDGLENIYHTGIQLKKKILNKSFCLRFSGQISVLSFHTSYSNVFDNRWDDTKYDQKKLEVRIGIEKVIFNNSRLRPFFFADILYQNINESGVEKSGDSFSYNYVQTNIDNTKQNLGALIGIGLKYYPSNNIYFSIESGLSLTKRLYEPELPSIVTYEYLYPIKTIAFGVRF